MMTREGKIIRQKMADLKNQKCFDCIDDNRWEPEMCRNCPNGKPQNDTIKGIGHLDFFYKCDREDCVRRDKKGYCNMTAHLVKVIWLSELNDTYTLQCIDYTNKG